MHADEDEGEAMVGLIRVSTGKQDESGLGQKGQEMALETYRRQHNGIYLRIYQEVESGTHGDISNRPQFRAAVSHARRSNATLVIAKIDRLLRSVEMLAYLKKTQVRFRACDNPYANELTIDILVVVAADEARRIAARTTAALEAYRQEGRVSKRIRELYRAQGIDVPPEVLAERGGKLGSHLPECRNNLSPEAAAKGRLKGARARRDKAAEAYADLGERIKELKDKGESYRAIAALLNAEGHTTTSGRQWSATQVYRVLKRLPAD